MTQEEGEKMYKRRQSREVSVGNVKIGGNNHEFSNKKCEQNRF